MRRTITLLSYVLFAAGAVFLVSADMHTDDTGILVGCIIVLAFLLGCLHPKRAWQWPLLLAVSIVAAEIYNRQSSGPRPSLQGAGGFALLGAFITAVGMAGSYAGVGVRRIFRH